MTHTETRPQCGRPRNRPLAPLILCCAALTSTVLLFAPPARCQSSASFSVPSANQHPPSVPILEAIDHAEGCCEGYIHAVHLRVFAGGRIEWDQMDGLTTSRKLNFILRNSAATKKEMKAVRWAVASMSGLAPGYTGAAAYGNIDNNDWIEIIGRDAKEIHKVNVGFGSSIAEWNYANLPPGLKTVVCTIEIIRESRTHEATPDLSWCRKYYVGY